MAKSNAETVKNITKELEDLLPNGYVAIVGGGKWTEKAKQQLIAQLQAMPTESSEKSSGGCSKCCCNCPYHNDHIKDDYDNDDYEDEDCKDEDYSCEELIDQIDELEEENCELEEKIEELETDNRDLEEKIKKLENRLNKIVAVANND